MKARPTTLLAIAVVAASLTFGMLALAIGRVDVGVQFVQDGAYVRIASVAHDSPAQLEGFVPGMVVVSINDTTLLRLPQYAYSRLAEGQRQAGQFAFEQVLLAERATAARADPQLQPFVCRDVPAGCQRVLLGWTVRPAPGRAQT